MFFCRENTLEFEQVGPRGLQKPLVLHKAVPGKKSTYATSRGFRAIDRWKFLFILREASKKYSVWKALVTVLLFRSINFSKW